MRHSKIAGMAAAYLLYALVAVLVAAFMFYYYANSMAETGKRSLTIKRMTLIEAAMEKHCFDCAGALPTAKQTLRALLEKPEKAPHGWAGPYLEDATALRDGWGRPLKYTVPGVPSPGNGIRRPYELSCYGKDGCEGGEGVDQDIRSSDRSSMVP